MRWQWSGRHTPQSTAPLTLAGSSARASRDSGGRFGRGWLGDQVSEPVPGSAEVGAPPYGGLQVHPEPRGDRMRPDECEPDTLQPTGRDHAGRAVVVSADRLKCPDV